MSAGKIAYSSLLKSYFIDGVFVPIFHVCRCFPGDRRYQILEGHGTAQVTGAKPKGQHRAAITATISEILSHKRFEQCNVTKDRKMAHMLGIFQFHRACNNNCMGGPYLYGYEIMEAMGKTPYSWMLGRPHIH